MRAEARGLIMAKLIVISNHNGPTRKLGSSKSLLPIISSKRSNFQFLEKYQKGNYIGKPILLKILGWMSIIPMGRGGVGESPFFQRFTMIDHPYEIVRIRIS